MRLYGKRREGEKDSRKHATDVQHVAKIAEDAGGVSTADAEAVKTIAGDNPTGIFRDTDPRVWRSTDVHLA